jgi:very-short-patch-repair endonuclease/transposase-like protein
MSRGNTKLTPEIKDFIISEYKKGTMSNKEIFKEIGVSSTTFYNWIKSWGLTDVEDNWTKKEIEWLKNNYLKPYEEMVKHLDKCSEAIRIKIQELELDRSNHNNFYKKIDPEDEEWWNDIDNPRLTAPEIVEKYKNKYDIGESSIHKYRKRRQIKLQIDSINKESKAEKQVRKIIEKLDLAYIQEKQIGPYHIDFYLGLKLCIEVQGDYWHSKNDRKESDKRKRKYLYKRNYKILYIWESEINEGKEKILQFVKESGFPIK